MKFECGDLERALAVSELMPEAREHLKHCAACRREYRLWNEISASAKDLHEEWESPELWPNIRRSLEAEPKPKLKPVWWRESKMWLAAAAVLVGLLLSQHRLQSCITNGQQHPFQPLLATVARITELHGVVNFWRQPGQYSA